jgi:hypothetical protein
VVPWIFFAYGAAAVGLEAWWRHDELLIASGLESIVLALVDFLWAGEIAALALALRLLGAAAPLIAYGTAPLFWHQVTPFASTAFWASMGLGLLLAVPLFLLARLVERSSLVERAGRDPRWMRGVRWAFRAGLGLIVLAMRAGAWDAGVLLVYAGAALALVALGIVLPRRLAVGRRGVGALLAVLGVAALVVIALAKLVVGGHMSGAETATGAIPAALVTAAGAALLLVRR